MTGQLRITAWRDHDRRVLDAVPDLMIGTTTVAAAGATAADLVAGGAARVRLHRAVDAGSPAAPPALLLIRELTRRGVVVDWDLVLDPVDHDWRELSHLYPPASLTGSADGAAGLRRWREGFFLGKFLIRRGPGFVEVRDWRWSRCRVTRVTDAAQVALIGWLADHTMPADAAAPAVSGLEDISLLQHVGGQLWLPAYRLWRWPSPAELV